MFWQAPSFVRVKAIGGEIRAQRVEDKRATYCFPFRFKGNLSRFFAVLDVLEIGSYIMSVAMLASGGSYLTDGRTDNHLMTYKHHSVLG